MIHWIDQYPYLFAVLLGLPPVFLAFALVPSQRKMMLIGGVVLAMFSPFSVLYEGVYWTPPRLSGGSWGIEDVLVCLSIGMLVCSVAIWPDRKSLMVRFQLTRCARRIGIFGIISAGSIIVLDEFMTMMVATIVVQFALLIGLLILRAEFWPMAARVGTIFLFYYALMLFIAGSLSSTFHAMWNGTELLGPRLLNLPIEEYLWAGSLGFLPMMLAYAADMRIVATVSETEVFAPDDVSNTS